MTLHKHFHEYVTKIHGDPDTVWLVSPFSREATDASHDPGAVTVIAPEIVEYTALA
jgi:hypothetical protein